MKYESVSIKKSENHDDEEADVKNVISRGGLVVLDTFCSYRIFLNSSFSRKVSFGRNRTKSIIFFVTCQIQQHFSIA